ncbi:MAG TPA: TetR/AcrR family transcriptional regulator [Acidimicrobiales bacterium]|nr:TetR/AcrR family transcriptional regulator [Acidimicrobiales bacterium]
MATGDTEPRGRDRRTLSREAIIATAIAVIDERGLDGLTMRNLGRALAVDPMTVYGYFEDKAALFDAIVDHEAARLHAVPEPLPTEPMEIMVHVALHHRRVLLEHPNLAPLVASRPLPKGNWAEVVRVAFDLCRAAGVADEDIPQVTNTITRFSMGFIVQEAGEVRYRERMGERPEAYRTRLLSTDCAPADAPELGVRTFTHRFDPTEAAQDFELGIRALLRGLGVSATGTWPRDPDTAA